ncbi:MAG: hypothetical protein JO129_01435 [Candidatus Dependentiae bacterium]|nr:hypothetical protein [Candidatus Dependentiae bacterium]
MFTALKTVTLAAMLVSGNGQPIPTRTEVMCGTIIENHEIDFACENMHIKHSYIKFSDNPEYKPLIDQLAHDIDTLKCHQHLKENPLFNQACQGEARSISHYLRVNEGNSCPDILIENDVLAICRKGFPEKYKAIQEQYKPFQ